MIPALPAEDFRKAGFYTSENGSFLALQKGEVLILATRAGDERYVLYGAVSNREFYDSEEIDGMIAGATTLSAALSLFDDSRWVGIDRTHREFVNDIASAKKGRSTGLTEGLVFGAIREYRENNRIETADRLEFLLEGAITARAKGKEEAERFTSGDYAHQAFTKPSSPRGNGTS